MSEKHDCIIGIWNDYDDYEPVTLNRLIEKVDGMKEYVRFMKQQLHYHDAWEIMDLSDYLDKRKSTNLTRFEYCPYCGKQIDWKKLKSDVKEINK